MAIGLSGEDWHWTDHQTAESHQGTGKGKRKVAEGAGKTWWLQGSRRHGNCQRPWEGNLWHYQGRLSCMYCCQGLIAIATVTLVCLIPSCCFDGPPHAMVRRYHCHGYHVLFFLLCLLLWFCCHGYSCRRWKWRMPRSSRSWGPWGSLWQTVQTLKALASREIALLRSSWVGTIPPLPDIASVFQQWSCHSAKDPMCASNRSIWGDDRWVEPPPWGVHPAADPAGHQNQGLLQPGWRVIWWRQEHGEWRWGAGDGLQDTERPEQVSVCVCVRVQKKEHIAQQTWVVTSCRAHCTADPGGC